MFSKSFTRSRIVWSAFAEMLVKILELCQQNLPQLQGLLKPWVYSVAAFVLPIAILLFRFDTYQAIHFRAPPDMGAGGKT